MHKGNIHATVCWLMEHSGGAILKPSDSTIIGGTSMTVLEVLGPRLPNPFAPPDWIMSSSLQFHCTL